MLETLPGDKRPQMGEALGNFALLGIACHALVIGGDLQHLIARNLHTQAACHDAALKCPLSAPSAFRHGNWQRHGNHLRHLRNPVVPRRFRAGK